MSKTLKIVIGIIVVVLVVWGLSSSNNSSTEKLHISSILSLTGPASFFGEELKNGMDLANDTKKLDVVYGDSESTPAKGVSAFQQAIAQQKPDLAIIMLSAVNAATMPIALENKIPVLQTLTSASKIGAQSPYSFRYFTSGEQEAPIAASIMVDVVKAQKIAAIYTNDEYGLAYFNALKEAVQAKGATIVANEAVGTKDTDFKTQLTKINSQKPDAIYMIALDKSLATMIKQARELKTPAKLFTNWVLANPAVRDMVKGDAEGIYLTSPSYYLSTPSSLATEFVNSYKAKYKKDPSAYAAIGYDVINILDNVKKAKGDNAENIIQKLTDIKSIKGVMGDLNIDQEGEITFALFPVVIKDGNLTEVK